MSKSRYEEIGESMGVERSQMFGKPCLKSNGKAFAAYFEDCMVFKLGREHQEELLKEYPGASNFDPSGKGRPMKDWFQIPAKYSGSWPTLAEEAKSKLEHR